MEEMTPIGEVTGKYYDYDREKVALQRKKRNEALTAQCAAEYPGCTVPDKFIFDYFRAQAQDTACEKCVGLPCMKEKTPCIKHKTRIRIGSCGG